MGSPGYFGRMLKMHAMLASGSGAVNWRVVTGDTAEEAADNAKTAIETFQSGGDYSSYVKASGNWGQVPRLLDDQGDADGVAGLALRHVQHANLMGGETLVDLLLRLLHESPEHQAAQ